MSGKFFRSMVLGALMASAYALPSVTPAEAGTTTTDIGAGSDWVLAYPTAGAALILSNGSGVQPLRYTTATASPAGGTDTGSILLPNQPSVPLNLAPGYFLYVKPLGSTQTARAIALDGLSSSGGASSGTQQVDTVVKGTATNRSGTIAAGGTAQVFAPANTARRGFSIQNQSQGKLCLNGLATATLDNQSLCVDAGNTYETPVSHVGTGALSIIGATTGQAFYAREF